MKMLAKTITVAALGALAAFGITNATAGDESEQKVQLADCPAAVQKTINDNANGGQVVEVEKETKKDGTVVYEAEVKKTDGTEIEIEVAEDGTLIDIEIEDDDGDDD